MTVLDAMIAVGGLGEYAAGNKARLVRFDKGSGKQQEFSLRLNDLIKRGDIKANVRLQPGDVIIIPERSEEHTSELQSLMRISSGVFCLKKQKQENNQLT